MRIISQTQRAFRAAASRGHASRTMLWNSLILGRPCWGLANPWEWASFPRLLLRRVRKDEPYSIPKALNILRVRWKGVLTGSGLSVVGVSARGGL